MPILRTHVGVISPSFTNYDLNIPLNAVLGVKGVLSFVDCHETAPETPVHSSIFWYFSNMFLNTQQNFTRALSGKKWDLSASFQEKMLIFGPLTAKVEPLTSQKTPIPVHF